jgi:hypothetical protein
MPNGVRIILTEGTERISSIPAAIEFISAEANADNIKAVDSYAARTTKAFQPMASV